MKKVCLQCDRSRRVPEHTHLVLLQLVPPTLKEALLCGRLRSNRPSSSRRLRLDMVPVCCSFSESHAAEE